MRYRPRRNEDESVESIEDRLRHLIPVREGTDGPITYRPIPRSEDGTDHERRHVRQLPAVNQAAAVFVAHSDWEPVFKDEKGNPVKRPRALRHAEERERFARNIQGLRMAWLVDQAWVWQLFLILLIVGLTAWLLVAHWSWTTGLLVLAGAGAIVWYVKRYGGW